jgi:hypothetical protein
VYQHAVFAVWLHDHLLASLPHCLIPPAPSKKSMFAGDTETQVAVLVVCDVFVRSRDRVQAANVLMRALTKFLNDV